MNTFDYRTTISSAAYLPTDTRTQTAASSPDELYEYILRNRRYQYLSILLLKLMQGISLLDSNFKTSIQFISWAISC